jgi:hypothetical protein
MFDGGVLNRYIPSCLEGQPVGSTYTGCLEQHLERPWIAEKGCGGNTCGGNVHL